MNERQNKVGGTTLRRLSLTALATVLGWGLIPIVHGQNFNLNEVGTSMAEALDSSQSFPATSEEQLRQLKQGLLSLAMQRKARVAASGWTNSSGTMREDVMIFSELELEKLRPLVRSGRYGRETTELAYLEDAPGSQCADRPARPQRLGLVIRPSSNTSPANHNLARDATGLVIDGLRSALDQGVLSSVAALINTATSSSPEVSAYHHFMTAGPARQQDMQLQIAVTVASDRSILRRFAPFETVRDPKRLAVELSLVTKGKAVASWRKSFAIGSMPQSKRDQLAWLVLPERSKTALTSWLAQTMTNLSGAINCHSETAIAMAADGARATLQAGHDVGLYAGQRLVILPTSNRMRERGLQPSMSVIGLAEVAQVGPNSATVNVYAGPKAGDYAGMMAIPLSALSP